MFAQNSKEETAAPEESEPEDPLAAAAEAAAQKQAEADAKPLLLKPPYFSYGSHKEQIDDAEMTFEMLREQKEEEFQEFSTARLVSWKIEYGTMTQAVAKPSSTKVYEMKKSMEVKPECGFSNSVVIGTTFEAKRPLDIKGGDYIVNQRVVKFTAPVGMEHLDIELFGEKKLLNEKPPSKKSVQVAIKQCIL